MLRTLEALFVVLITFSVVFALTNYVYLEPPRNISSIGQQEYAQDLLKRVDENKTLTNAVFDESGESWSGVVKTLIDIVPPNVIFNITSYKISEDIPGTLKYVPINTGGNFKGVFPSGSVSVSYTVTSPEVTVTQTPEKIGYIKAGGEQMFTTLYILKCTDANGWWTTGYTSETLALDIYHQMSPYFETTVMVNSTTDFERLLNGNKITGSPSENVTDAIIINTFGECVPIPASKVSSPESFPNYLGRRVALYNWTWVSIVGYPFYYVSNTEEITGQNDWGIYGMTMIDARGLNGFIRGINNQAYTNDNTWRTSDIGVVSYATFLEDCQDYYGIYPGHSQTSTRALPGSWLTSNNFRLRLNIFDPVGNYYAGAAWAHEGTDGLTHGTLFALGLARTPDIKVAILGILAMYHPTIYRSDFSVSGTTRIVTLQIGQQGAS